MPPVKSKVGTALQVGARISWSCHPGFIPCRHCAGKGPLFSNLWRSDAGTGASSAVMYMQLGGLGRHALMPGMGGPTSISISNSSQSRPSTSK